MSKTPFPTPDAVIELLEDRRSPTGFNAIARRFRLKSSRQRRELDELLAELVDNGSIVTTDSGSFGPAAGADTVQGDVVGHPEGHGFLNVTDDGRDFFLSRTQMDRLIHGDRVAVRVGTARDRRGRYEVEVLELIEGRTRLLTGRLRRGSGSATVVPDNPRIDRPVFVKGKLPKHARDGDVVVIEITGHPFADGDATGTVVEVLGPPDAAGMPVEVALRAFDIPHRFEQSALRQADGIGDRVPQSASADREDLRDLPLVTIDGEDARDFDDAVAAKRQPDGFRLWVAIADVSHYVTPGSPLDREADQRGNSVYFTDRVVPMLPEALSNGICSLKPRVNRLALVCEMDLGNKGALRGYRFYPAVIRSRHRLTYTRVAGLIDSGFKTRDRLDDETIASLETLHGIYQIMLRRRRRRGALDLDIPEVRPVIDDNGRITGFDSTRRNQAHRLIEECMLLANTCAAGAMVEKAGTGVYRIHEKPRQARLAESLPVLSRMGVRFTGPAELTAGEIMDGLDRSELSGERLYLAHSLLLRTMSQARYSTHNVGHYALNYPAYTHFTSPIRRYPDLLVHRILKSIYGFGPDQRPPGGDRLERRLEHSSYTERRADEATRDVINYYQCEYMAGRVGEKFDGFISGVTPFGLFVELDGIRVSGLVHVTSIGRDYFRFDERSLSMTGERSGQRYTLGDRIRVTLASVSLDERRIDFELAGAASGGRKNRRRR